MGNLVIGFHRIGVRPELPHPCLSVVLQEQNTIRVWNSGDGIPVEMHKTEGVYVPELIFGHLLTSSNYDDNEKKVGVRMVVTATRGSP